MGVTIHDVAEQAGVSIATASRALSGSRRVSPESARRVAAAARSLDYRPNMVASSLRRQVTDTIGLVIPQISNPFFPALVEAIELRLKDASRQLLLAESQSDVEVERQRLRSLVDRRVDGVIVTPCHSTLSADTLRSIADEVPLVQIDRHVHAEVTDWVGVDNEAGMRLIAGHLAAGGVRSALFVGAATTISTAKSRLSGFALACEELGIATPRPLLGDFTVEWGTAAARSLLERPQLPDAIVCGNDLIAIGALRQLILAGVRVPGDVLLTGFDDIYSAELSTPSLTTVRQPNETIAREAIRLLGERMEDRGLAAQRITVAPELVVRESSSVSVVPTAPSPDRSVGEDLASQQPVS